MTDNLMTRQQVLEQVKRMHKEEVRIREAKVALFEKCKDEALEYLRLHPQDTASVVDELWAYSREVDIPLGLCIA